MNNTAAEMMLSPYRVLDLTDERGLLCGKILGDLGANVVQVEPPGGSPARQVGPFYGDDPAPDKSLYWWAYCANKRGITLNLEHPDGRSLLERIVASADFVIESFDPGYLDGMGLGYSRLSEINPSAVMVSITAFGQDGPYAGYQASDITGMALGGFMHLTGDPDRAPLRPSFPHFYLHGSAAGAAGAMLAHTHRALTGEGQHVDVSCQQAVARTLAHAPQIWDIEGAVSAAHGRLPPDLRREPGAHQLALRRRLRQLYAAGRRRGPQHPGAVPVDGGGRVRRYGASGLRMGDDGLRPHHPRGDGHWWWGRWPNSSSGTPARN